MWELVRTPAGKLAMPLAIAATLIAAYVGDGGAGGATIRFSQPAAASTTRDFRLTPVDDWEQVPADGGSASPAPGSQPAAEGSALGDHPRRGPAQAPVTIVEFSDFQCPYCRQAETTLREVRRRYGDQVRLVYMDFPLKSHAGAMDAALAARCAGEQGHFWEYHDALLGDQSQLSIIPLTNLAGQLGLDTASFSSCMSERRYEDAVRADMAAGANAGASGTPSFLVNGRLVRGAPSYAELSAMIEQALRQKRESTQPLSTQPL